MKLTRLCSIFSMSLVSFASLAVGQFEVGYPVEGVVGYPVEGVVGYPMGYDTAHEYCSMKKRQRGVRDEYPSTPDEKGKYKEALNVAIKHEDRGAIHTAVLEIAEKFSQEEFVSILQEVCEDKNVDVDGKQYMLDALFFKIAGGHGQKIAIVLPSSVRLKNEKIMGRVADEIYHFRRNSFDDAAKYSSDYINKCNRNFIAHIEDRLGCLYAGYESSDESATRKFVIDALFEKECYGEGLWLALRFGGKEEIQATTNSLRKYFGKNNDNDCSCEHSLKNVYDDALYLAIKIGDQSSCEIAFKELCKEESSRQQGNLLETYKSMRNMLTEWKKTNTLNKESTRDWMQKTINDCERVEKKVNALLELVNQENALLELVNQEKDKFEESKDESTLFGEILRRMMPKVAEQLSSDDPLYREILFCTGQCVAGGEDYIKEQPIREAFASCFRAISHWESIPEW